MPPRSSNNTHVAQRTRTVNALVAIFQRGLDLSRERTHMLQDALQQGTAHFETTNNARLQWSLAALAPQQRAALFELLFLCHTNVPEWTPFHFTGTRMERAGRLRRFNTQEMSKELYLKGAPCGVEGLSRFSTATQGAFEAHAREVFGFPPPILEAGSAPLRAVILTGGCASLTTTVAREALDVHLIHSRNLVSEDPLNLTSLREAILAFDANRDRNKDRLYADVFSKEHRPWLSRCLYGDVQQREFTLRGKLPGGLAALQRELMELWSDHLRIRRTLEGVRYAQMLDQRLMLINDYLQARYPQVRLRLSISGEGEETIRSCYQKIPGSTWPERNTYWRVEEMLSGVMLTPMLPLHEVLPSTIQESGAQYLRIAQCIRYGLIPSYHAVRKRLVDLSPQFSLTGNQLRGSAEELPRMLLRGMRGIWPEALLRILRFEMMLDPRYRASTNHLLRSPRWSERRLNPQQLNAHSVKERRIWGVGGLSPKALLSLEHDHPSLWRDPHWLRYKAIKMALAEPGGLSDGLPKQRLRLSSLVDVAFGLNLYESPAAENHVAPPAKDLRAEVHRALREQMFPPSSMRHRRIKAALRGDETALGLLERAFREALLRASWRTQQLLKKQGMGLQLLFKRTLPLRQEILQRLRARPGALWVRPLMEQSAPYAALRFRCTPKHGWRLEAAALLPQRSTTHGRSRAGKLSPSSKAAQAALQRSSASTQELPLVMIRKASSCLVLLGEAVLNGLYTPGERMEKPGLSARAQRAKYIGRTEIMMDAQEIHQGNRLDDNFASLRAEDVHRLLQLIITFFRDREHHHAPQPQPKRTRQITDLFVLLHFFKLGRLSLFYRDDLGMWWVREWDHPAWSQSWSVLRGNLERMFGERSMHVTFAHFLQTQHVRLQDLRLEIWINPHSVHPYPTQQIVMKETELAQKYREVLTRVHWKS